MPGPGGGEGQDGGQGGSARQLGAGDGASWEGGTRIWAAALASRRLTALPPHGRVHRSSHPETGDSGSEPSRQPGSVLVVAPGAAYAPRRGPTRWFWHGCPVRALAA